MENTKVTRLLLLSLSIGMLFQACTVYHSQTVSMEEAFQQHTKVKMYSEKGRKYKFKWLEKEGELYVGYTKPNSNTAEKLLKVQTSQHQYNKFPGFYISSDSIARVQTKNKDLSTLATIGTTVLGTILVLYIIAAISFATSGFGFSWE